MGAGFTGKQLWMDLGEIAHAFFPSQPQTSTHFHGLFTAMCGLNILTVRHYVEKKTQCHPQLWDRQSCDSQVQPVLILLIALSFTGES